MRRIISLAVIACLVLLWGDWTLGKLRASDAKIHQLHTQRLEIAAHLRVLERSLSDFHGAVEATVSNRNAAAQTRLIVSLQDQRGQLWNDLEPLRPHLAKAPARLDELEAQYEGLGLIAGDLIKTLVKAGPVAAQAARVERWNQRFTGVQKSTRAAAARLRAELETEYQATLVVQDDNLKTLIFGVCGIAAFALCWVGFLLTRSRGRTGKMDEGLDRLAKILLADAGAGKPEARLGHLLENLKSAPVGQKFLGRILGAQMQPCALLIDGKLQALSEPMDASLGGDAKGLKAVETLAALGPAQEQVTKLLSSADGDWHRLVDDAGKDCPLQLRACTLSDPSLRFIELIDERTSAAAEAAGAEADSLAGQYVFTAVIAGAGEVLSVSPSLCAYIGVSESDLKLAHLTDLDLGIGAELPGAIITAIDADGIWRGAVQVNRADNSIGHLTAHITKSKGSEEGAPIYCAAAIATDEATSLRAQLEAVEQRIAAAETDSKGAQDQRQRVAKRLTTEATDALQSLARLQDLINAFGCEMRDPLNGVVGLTELLRGSAAPQRLAQLQTVSTNLTELVYDLLDHARIETGDFELNLGAVDLEAAVRKVVVRHARHLAGSNLQIELKPVPADLDFASGDAIRITQIIDALVARAIRYALPGGLISAHIEQEPDGRLCVAIHDAGGALPASASDELLDLVSFSGAAGAARWSGMEPATLKAIAGAMEAELDARVEGDEIVWRFHLTAAPRGSAAAAAVPSRLAPVVAGLPPVVTASVLVADDDEVNRVVATGLLERMGCAVQTVDDGEAALMTLATYLDQGGRAPIDLILLDLMMPRLGGLETATAIRKAEAEHGISGDDRVPIVAVTARVSEEDERACLDIGMNAFVSKPYRHDELGLLISRFVRS
jgi:CheY-like chemotaxis protein